MTPCQIEVCQRNLLTEALLDQPAVTMDGDNLGAANDRTDLHSLLCSDRPLALDAFGHFLFNSGHGTGNVVTTPAICATREQAVSSKCCQARHQWTMTASTRSQPTLYDQKWACKPTSENRKSLQIMFPFLK
jgi:hypothetical protein